MAEADVAEIWSYIAQRAGEAIATRFVAAIEEAMQPILYFPLTGAARDHLATGLA